VVQGGSTITQQLAKNLFLNNERSIERKIKEAILAFRLERALPKDRILELYLNEIYLGIGAYGVAAAALNYFDKSLDQLTVAEIAYLAALPKAPSDGAANHSTKPVNGQVAGYPRPSTPSGHQGPADGRGSERWGLRPPRRFNGSSRCRIVCPSPGA
jgi:hypothetical protein